MTCTFGRGLTDTKLETDLNQLRFVMFSELTETVLFFTLLPAAPRQGTEISCSKQKTVNRVMRPQADAEGRKHPPVPGQSGRVSPKWSLVCLRALLLPGQWGPEGSFLLLVNAWISIQVRDYSSLLCHPDFVFTRQGQPKPCGPCPAKFTPCLTEAMAEVGDGSPGCLATTTKVRTWHHVGA